MDLRVSTTIGEDATYEIVAGCLVVQSGAMSLTKLRRILRDLGIEQTGHFSGVHSRRIGAKMVIGDTHGLRRLKLLNLEPCQAVQNDAQRALKMGLGMVAANWINGYERTVASDTLFSFLTGVNVLHEVEPDLPHSERSLLSCMRMLDLMPELHEQFRHVSVLNRNWQALMAVWNALQSAVEETHPPWRTRHFRMLPLTRRTIAKVLNETGLCDAECESTLRTGSLVHMQKTLNTDEPLYWVIVDDAKYQWLDKFNRANELTLGAEIHFRRLENLAAVRGQEGKKIQRIEINAFSNVTLS